MCSPAGTTIQAVRVLEEKGMRLSLIHIYRKMVYSEVDVMRAVHFADEFAGQKGAPAVFCLSLIHIFFAIYMHPCVAGCLAHPGQILVHSTKK